MARIYLPREAIRDGCVWLAGEALHHVRTVLRLREGDQLQVTDGAGAEYRVRLERGGREAMPAAVLERTEPDRESPLRTILAQAVPKGDRFSYVLQKAVELGVTEIIPIVSRRTVVTLPGGDENARFARWRRIIEAAVAQSGRTRLPVLHPPQAWNVLEAGEMPAEAELKILLWEGEPRGLRDLLGTGSGLRSVLVAIGPEGGWSEIEVERARRAGFLTARVGPRILRTETVGLVALAILQHRYGDLG